MGYHRLRVFCTVLLFFISLGTYAYASQERVVIEFRRGEKAEPLCRSIARLGFLPKRMGVNDCLDVVCRENFNGGNCEQRFRSIYVGAHVVFPFTLGPFEEAFAHVRTERDRFAARVAALEKEVRRFAQQPRRVAPSRSAKPREKPWSALITSMRHGVKQMQMRPLHAMAIAGMLVLLATIMLLGRDERTAQRVRTQHAMAHPGEWCPFVVPPNRFPVRGASKRLRTILLQKVESRFEHGERKDFFEVPCGAWVMWRNVLGHLKCERCHARLHTQYHARKRRFFFARRPQEGWKRTAAEPSLA